MTHAGAERLAILEGMKKHTWIMIELNVTFLGPDFETDTEKAAYKSTVESG